MNKCVVITSKNKFDFSKCLDSYYDIKNTLEIEHFEGIFPSETSKEYSESFKLRYGRAPLKGEYGCYMSHASVWKKFHNEQAIVVLEDDAVCGKSDCIKHLISYCGYRTEPTIIKLGVSKLKQREQWLYYLIKPILPKKIFLDRILCKEIFLNTDGTVAYVINRCAMQLLSQASYECRGMLADDWNGLRKLGVNVFSLRPFDVFEDGQRESEIDREQLRKRSINYNLTNLIKMLLFLPLSLLFFLLAFIARCAK